ncbi:hypothetical protein IBX73_08900 [candidate division WOR-3 bacterium]|nr:hypothetical protein [candidate division WOR-3 bacterium]
MNKNSNYGKMLLKYRGKWVALSRDEKTVIAAGNSLPEAIEKASKTKEKQPIYVMVSNTIGNFSF